MKNGIRTAFSEPLGERPLTVKLLRRRRASADRHRGAVFRPLGAPHLEDVEQPVDAVLQPVDDEDPPHIPAEPQDADQWNEVGDDQGGDGRVRGTDLVPGDEALHAPDASGSARVACDLGVQFDRCDRDRSGFAAALDAEVDAPPDDVADEAPLQVADALDRAPVELDDDVADAHAGAGGGPGFEQLDDLEAARPAEPVGDGLAERSRPADDAEVRASDATVDDQRSRGSGAWRRRSGRPGRARSRPPRC